MTQKIVLIDDLDGSEAVKTVRFAYEDRDFEIDLSEENGKKFAELLQPYLTAGRKAEPPPISVMAPPRRRGAGTRRGEGRQDLSLIRAWAKEQGLNVSDRGRVRADIIAQYDREHG